MKKVLALVLALTMVLGFAATASASWNIKYDLLTNANTFDNLTVGGDSYDPDMAVDGNKEYLEARAYRRLTQPQLCYL